MALIHYVVPKLLWSIGEQKTLERFNYYLVIQNWKVLLRYLGIEVDDALEMAEQTEV